MITPIKQEVVFSFSRYLPKFPFTGKKVLAGLLIKVFILVLLSLPLTAQSAFPPEYYPTSHHPRLWLTPEREAAFALAQKQKNERWLEFKNLCDTLIDTDPTNDPYNLEHAPQHYTAPLALMYRLTGDERYAAKALVLMDLTPLHFNYAEPDHENYQYLGVAYDWLYDYSGLTEAKKISYRSKMKQISDYFWTENINASGTDSDKNLLTGALHFILGVAIFGESSDAITFLDRGWHGWETGYFHTFGTSNKNLIRDALGGVYFAGMDYFNSTDGRGIAQHWLTFKTAFNYDINVIDPSMKHFWGDTLKSIFHLTEPSRKRIYHYGSWQDPNILSGQSWMHRALTMASYFSDLAGDSSTAAMGRGYSSEVDVGYHGAIFEEFFFDSPGAQVISPYSGSVPLVRFANEPDFLLFRTNWNESANWGLFIGNGSIPFDHQAPDHGHFTLWRDNEYLTKGARSYESGAHGDFFNTLSIENSCYYDPHSCSGTALFLSEKAASISRHREQGGNPLFAYAMLEADGQWNDHPSEYQPVANVKTYRRHFFWSNEYAVVFDRLRTEIPLSTKYRLRALTEPSINGTIVSQLSQNGQHKLLQRTLEPSGITITKIDESLEWGHLADWVINSSERKWQSVLNLPASTYVNILNVIQTGPASLNTFDSLEHLSDTSSSGVRIGDWVVCFSKEEVLRTSVNYSVKESQSGMWHLITDLAPGYYNINAGTDKLKTIEVTGSDNTALFRTFSKASVLNIEIVPGTQPPPDPKSQLFWPMVLPAITNGG